MFQARFINPQGQSEKIRADLYDPAVHGTEIMCADPRCCARMRFQAETRAEGYMTRTAHFVSLDVREHHSKCTAWTLTEQHQQSETISDAFINHHHIVIHLNMDLGIPRMDAFKRAAKGQDKKLQLAWFKSAYQGEYKSISVSSLDELLNVQNMLRERRTLDYKGQIIVSHGGMIINESALHLETKDAQIKHFKKMVSGKGIIFRDKTKKRLYGFPRLVQISATKHSREAGPKAPIRSKFWGMIPQEYQAFLGRERPQPVSYNEVILLQTVYFAGDARDTCAEVARRIKSAYVLAVPYISFADRANISDMNHYDFTSDRKFVGVSWRVVSPAQFYIHDATPVGFKPPVDQQPRLI